jgi:hypothetical protein
VLALARMFDRRIKGYRGIGYEIAGGRSGMVAVILAQEIQKSYLKLLTKKEIPVRYRDPFQKQVVGAEGRICQIVNDYNKLVIYK